METAQQHIAQQELCAASISRDGEQHRVQKVEAQLMHVFFTVRVDVYKTIACNESICANLWETLSESQCKDTTFLIPNSPMLKVAPRYSSIITDRFMLHKYDT